MAILSAEVLPGTPTGALPTAGYSPSVLAMMLRWISEVPP
jgi:hypothetical protein